MSVQGDNLYHLIESVYSDMSQHLNDPAYFAGRAILTAKNKDVSTINSIMLDFIPGEVHTYRSFDIILRTELHQLDVPIGLMNAIEHASLPPYELSLKVGSPIMTLRNIDPVSGVCNGTRLIVTSLGPNIIEALIATGPQAGRVILIPKIQFQTFATEGIAPFDFERYQFPVRLAFEMTINKAHGQTLDSMGLYLPGHVFGHGQLYVTLSRVPSPAAIRVMISREISSIPDRVGTFTHNIVFKEVFDHH